MPRRAELSLQALCTLLIALLALTGCDKSSDRATPPVVVDRVTSPQAEAGEQELPEPPERSHEPLLWQVDGPESSSVYLLGTVHVGIDAKAVLPQYVWRKIDQADTFYVEIDQSAIQLQQIQRAALPSGTTLEGMLTEQEWAKLDELMGGTANTFSGFKPWFIISLLTIKMLPKGVSPTEGMDLVLHQYASSRGKRLAYLEDPALQLEVMEETLTLEDLKEMIRDYDEQKKDLALMLDYYRAGDVEQMKSISFKDLDEHPEKYEKLLYERNEAWIPQIEEALEREGDTFFAFGANHLFDERGVLDLLEKRGHKPYRLTRALMAKEEEDEAPTR